MSLLTEMKEKKYTPYVQFPKLMENDFNVVLFKEERKGVVVHRKNSRSAVALGSYISSWDMSKFKDYEGSLTLQNLEDND